MADGRAWPDSQPAGKGQFILLGTANCQRLKGPNWAGGGGVHVGGRIRRVGEH